MMALYTGGVASVMLLRILRRAVYKFCNTRSTQSKKNCLNLLIPPSKRRSGRISFVISIAAIGYFVKVITKQNNHKDKSIHFANRDRSCDEIAKIIVEKQDCGGVDWDWEEQFDWEDSKKFLSIILLYRR